MQLKDAGVYLAHQVHWDGNDLKEGLGELPAYTVDDLLSNLPLAMRFEVPNQKKYLDGPLRIGYKVGTIKRTSIGPTVMFPRKISIWTLDYDRWQDIFHTEHEQLVEAAARMMLLLMKTGRMAVPNYDPERGS